MVRDLYGSQRHFKYDKVMLITTSNFSIPAKAWAVGKPDLVLINAKMLCECIYNTPFLQRLMTE